MTSIAEKYAQQCQPNGEASLAALIQAALAEQAEAFKGELRAYDGTVRELAKTVEDMQAAQSVPVVGEPAAWSQYAFSQNGLSSCAGSNSLVIGTSNTCSHNDCLVIGTQLTTTKHGQVLIGNKEVHQTGDISPEELSVFKDILLKTRYPAPSITAVELATLREKAAMVDEAHDVLRTLACELGAGGYNAEIVDASVFEHKIRDGVNMLLNPLMNRVSQAEQERDELRKDAERLRRLESEISGRSYSYGWFGATCTFEGLPMVNAEILEELSAIAQGKGE